MQTVTIVQGDWGAGEGESVVGFLAASDYRDWREQWYPHGLPDALKVGTARLPDVLWVGSLWHRDCDPFVTVAATTQEKAREVLADLAEEEYRAMLDEEEEGEPEDDIRTGGVCPEGILDALQEVPERDRPEKIGDLVSQGYCII